MKKFFHKIGLFFAKVFGGVKKFEKFLEEHVDDAIAIGLKILEYSHSPIVLAAEGLLEYLLGDKYKKASQDVINKVLDALSKAIDDMQIAEACFQKPTTQEKILCFLEAIRAKKSQFDKEGTVVKTMSRYVAHVSGTEVKNNILDSVVQTRITDKKYGITA